MKDANSLRELVKTTSDDNKLVFEKSADILWDKCSSVIKNHKIREGTKEICIEFHEINEDFSQFNDAYLKINEKPTKTFREIAEESIYFACYARYLPLEFALTHCKETSSFSGLVRTEQDREGFRLLSKVLEERGLYCCATCSYDGLCFAVVLQL